MSFQKIYMLQPNTAQDGNKRLVAGGDMGVATSHKSQCHLSRRPSPRRRCLLPVSGEGLRATASGAWTYHSARRCGPGNFSMGGESAGVFFWGLFRCEKFWV